MPSLVPALIISDRLSFGDDFAKLLAAEASDYVFDFKVISPERALEADISPLIIFIIITQEVGKIQAVEKIGALALHFPESLILPLFEGDEGWGLRPALLEAGADEVLPLGQFKGGLAGRMVVRLLDLQRALTAEGMLQESEERFRGIIENAHDIVTLLDAEGVIFYNSPAFERQTGYAPWESLGQVFFDFIHPDDVQRVKTRFYELVGGPDDESVGAIDFRFRHKNGQWLNISSVPTNQTGNEAVGAVVLNSRNVTEAREAEAQLEKYRLHLEDLVEQRTREAEEANLRADSVLSASPVSLMAMDNNGTITFVSRHYRQVYPASAHLLVPGKSVMDIFDSVAAEMNIGRDDPRYRVLKDWWSNPKGATELKLDNGIWLFLQARMMSDNRGVVILTTNITDHKRQEVLMAQSLEQERKALEQQKRFVSMVSHEFRTPLTIIDGSAQIIQSRGATLDAATLEKRSATIRESVRRLVSLIEDVLSANVLESGQLHLFPEPCDMRKILSDIAGEQEEISGKHKVRLELDGLPSSIVVDRKIMRQVFTNLVNNAVKYSPAAEEVIVSGACEGMGQKKHLVIRVSDLGVGIPEEELPKIFDRFFRASTAGSIPGTGVGLSLVREFVELHRGSLEVTSKVGRGTTITVRLPYGEES